MNHKITTLFTVIVISSSALSTLLDVGPDALGKIPIVAEKNLEAVGHWLDINGDAIYGTQRSPFNESYGGMAGRYRTRTAKPVACLF